MGDTASGSFVLLSSTEAYVVTLPVGESTTTSMRASVAERPFDARNDPSCWNSNGRSENGNSPRDWPPLVKTRRRPLATAPNPSTSPMFVRKESDCEIPVSVSEPAPDLRNFPTGTAGMNCPNVPVLVAAYVRLDTKVVAADPASTRMSSTPPAESEESAKPKKSFSTSLSATV